MKKCAAELATKYDENLGTEIINEMEFLNYLVKVLVLDVQNATFLSILNAKKSCELDSICPKMS